MRHLSGRITGLAFAMATGCVATPDAGNAPSPASRPAGAPAVFGPAVRASGRLTVLYREEGGFAGGVRAAVVWSMDGDAAVPADWRPGRDRSPVRTLTADEAAKVAAALDTAGFAVDVGGPVEEHLADGFGVVLTVDAGGVSHTLRAYAGNTQSTAPARFMDAVRAAI